MCTEQHPFVSSPSRSGIAVLAKVTPVMLRGFEDEPAGFLNRRLGPK